MASKLNFSAQLNLYTKGFEKGINSVKRQLKSLGGTFKSFAASMGAGLGIYQLVSQMSNVAKELNTAKTTLKNVSESMGDFNKSMQLAKNLARDYSQDMVSLTSNLASFQASAKGTGIALSDVNEIFTSLTKASAYFNLSSQQTSQVLTAVAQMMSKGTVQAQELKLQLANVLPGAFSMMAKAVGVTTSELDKLMSQGKLAAKDVLPKFAQELNKMTAGKIDTTGIQASMNRLKNTFTQFVTSVNFERFVAGSVNALDKLLSFIMKNINAVKTFGVALAGAFAGDKLANGWKKAKSIYQEFSNALKQNQDAIATLQKRLNSLNLAEHRLLAQRRKLIDQIDVLEGPTYDSYKMLSEDDIKKSQELIGNLRKTDSEIRNINSLQRQCNKELSGMQSPLKAALKSFNWMNLAVSAIMAALAAGVQLLVKWRKNTKEIENSLKTARKEAQAFEKEVSGRGKNSMAEQANILKSNLDIYSDMLAGENKRLAALNSINSILGLEGDKAFDIKSSYQDIVKEAKKWLTLQEKIAQVNAYSQGIAEAEVRREEANSKALEAIKEAALEREKKGEKLRGTVGGRLETDDEMAQRLMGLWKVNPYYRDSRLGRTANRISRNANGVSINSLVAQANAATSSEAKFRDALGKLLEEVGDEYAKTLGGGGGDGDDKSGVTNNVKEIIDDYLKSSEELSNQQKRNAISADEYKQQMDDLALKTYREITAFSDMEKQLKELPEKYKTTADDIAKQFATINGMAMIADELDKYRQSLTELQNQVKNNTITEDEYNDSLQTLKSDTYKAISSLVNFSSFLDGLPKDVADALKAELKGLGDAFKAEMEKAIKEGVQGGMKFLGNITKKPEMKSGDVTYSKSNKALGQQKELVDIDITNLENAISELKNSTNAEDWGVDVNDAIDDLTNQLEEARGKAKNLEDMMKFNDAVDELKKLKLQVIDSFFSIPDTMTGLADSVKEVIGAFNEDIDFEKYDKVMGKIKAIINLVNQVKSAVETALAIKNLFASFKEAEEAVSLMKATASVTDMVTKATKGEAMVQGMAAAATRKKATANMMEAGSNITAAAAAETKAGSTAKEAVAESASSAAKIPVVGWVMAGVAIAAMAGALIASFAKFATGGIVGGNSKHGDNNIIRANSGEMIMNSNQQKRLWNIISGKSGVGGVGGGGEVKFRIRGAELEGVLNNYRKQRKG